MCLLPRRDFDLVFDTYSSGILQTFYQVWGDITTLTRNMMKFLFTRKMVVPCLRRKKNVLTDTSLSTFCAIVCSSVYSVEVLQTLSVHKSLIILLFEDAGAAQCQHIQNLFMQCLWDICLESTEVHILMNICFLSEEYVQNTLNTLIPISQSLFAQFYKTQGVL